MRFDTLVLEPLFFCMIRHFLFFLAAFLISSLGYSQSNLLVKGKIMEGEFIPAEAATVFLSKAKDSTLVDYAVTNSQGVFELKVKKQTEPIHLVVSMIGFEDFKKEFLKVDETIDLGLVFLKAISTNLDELVIQADIPPIRIKKDTVEFNASSFKVRPDANVEELLKQLPGVEIDAEKKITVNGKEVNQILVNGKPFFDEDGNIAIQNIPSELINKVQITNTKSKKEEFTGKASTSDKASINLTIDEDKNKGLFGKFMGGYGSDERYESSGLLNYFKGTQKISVLGSSNNINASGFSMDEVFDNMGGGRTRRGGGNNFSRGSGITKSNLLGVNFSDEYFDKLQTNGSYMFSTSENENKNRSTRINLLPTDEFTTVSESKSNNYNENHNANFSFEYKIDSTSTLYMAPVFSKVFNRSTSTSSEFSEDADGLALNESSSSADASSNSVNFNNNLLYSKRFKRKGNYMSLGITNSNSKQDGVSHVESLTRFFKDNQQDDIRKQLRDTYSTSDNYNFNVEYSQPITDSLSLILGADYNYANSIDDRLVYDFNDLSGGYMDLNVSESNRYRTTLNQYTPKAGLILSKSNLTIDLESGVVIADNFSSALFNQENYSSSKNYISPHGRAFANYRLSKGMSLFGNYNYNVQYPTGFQVLDIEDVSNPLNTIVGNPDLKPSETHAAFLSFNNYNFASRSGYSINVNSSFFENQVVSTVVYDENRKRTTSYENISGSYNIGLGGNWSKSYKIEDHQLRYGFNARVSYAKTKGFTDGVEFVSKSATYSPRVYVSWDYGEVLSMTPSYSYNYFKSTYDNYMVDQANNFQHNFNIQLTSYWPKNWVFGNDFGYSYNSKIASGFKKSFYLWNTSLSYAFKDKAFVAKVKVYDLLNQNISSTRTLDPTMILDQENTVLKRYVMFSLAYKFDRFGNADSRERRGGQRRMRM